MSKYTKEELLRHVKTHTERSNDDRAAVTVLESFLRSNGEINHQKEIADIPKEVLEYIKSNRLYQYNTEAL